MRTYAQFCGLARALDHVGDRWSLLIARELLIRPKRFGELLEALPGIATNLLTERLRALEADGLVVRSAPGSTSAYELTPRGRDLEGAILELVRFGRHFMDAPRRGDAFRADWLALALRALLAPTAARDGVVSVTAGDTPLTIAVSGGVVSVDLGAPARRDCTVVADPQTLLGLAAGAETMSSARRAGRLRIRGDDRLFRDMLRPFEAF